MHLKTHPGFEPLRLRGLSGARDKLHFAAIVQNLKTLAARPGTIAACLRVRCVSASEGGVGGMNVKADATQWGGAKTHSRPGLAGPTHQHRPAMESGHVVASCAS